MLHTGYVRLSDGAHTGEYAVQTPTEWEAVSVDEVPADVRAEMDWLLQ